MVTYPSEFVHVNYSNSNSSLQKTTQLAYDYKMCNQKCSECNFFKQLGPILTKRLKKGSKGVSVKWKKCFSAIQEACSSSPKQALFTRNFCHLKQCIKVCKTNSKCFSDFSLLLPHAFDVLRKMAKSFKKPKDRTSKVQIDKSTLPLFCLEVKTCLSEETKIVNFSNSSISLPEIKALFDNEFSIPSEMFVFRSSGKRLTDSDVVELPNSVYADMLLLGGVRERKTCSNCQIKARKICGDLLCHRIMAVDAVAVAKDDQLMIKTFGEVLMRKV